jgi:acyl carrier protein
MKTIDRVKALIGDQINVPADTIADDAPLAGMGMDSLDRVELAIAVEEHFHVVVPDDHIESVDLGTPCGMAGYVDKLLSEKAAEPLGVPAEGYIIRDNTFAGNTISDNHMQIIAPVIAEQPITREEMIRRGVDADEGTAMSVIAKLGWPTAANPQGTDPTHILVPVPEKIDYAAMSPGEMHSALSGGAEPIGGDGMKWVEAFMQMASVAGPLGRAMRAYPDGDAQRELQGIMLGWFANAIMAGYDHARNNPEAIDGSALDSIAFTKKPVQIEAVEFIGVKVEDGTARAHFNRPDLPQWLLDAFAEADGDPGAAWLRHDGSVADAPTAPNVLVIGTLEGEHIASPGDWIIRGVAGEIYPCKPTIFAATYDPVPADDGAAAHEPL